MKMKWDTALTVTLAICALVTTGLVVRREFFAPSAATARQQVAKPQFIESWRSYLDQGVRIGPPDARVQLIEFSDFECPFCASFHKELKTLRQRYPKEIALSYVHFPLPGHRFAELAARVAECADAQGRFEAMHDVLFEQQRSFGLKPWGEFAAQAGVADASAFESCIRGTEPLPRVAAGKQLSEQLGIRGTPTIFINGWKLGRPPNHVELESMVKAILAGKSPVADEET
jgi:protein-disulfide isomerase